MLHRQDNENKPENYYSCRKCKILLEFTCILEHSSIPYKEKIIKENGGEIENKIKIQSGEIVTIKDYVDPMEFFVEHRTKSEILECPRCKTIIFRQYHLEDDCLSDREVVFPNHQQWHYEANSEFTNFLELELFSIYKELILSFNNSFFLSTGILIRALLEMICKKESIPGKNLEQKINSLPLNPSYKEMLHNIRVLGNNSAHKGYYGNKDELKNAIQAMECLIETLFMPSWKLKQVEIIKSNLESFKSSRR